MSDDGVGVHVVSRLRVRCSGGVLVTEVGTAVLDSVPLLAWADRVLVVDALLGGGPPGTVYSVPVADLSRSAGPCSLHQLDMSQALELLPRGTSCPDLMLIGIEPAWLHPGLELSPAVQAALPHALTVVGRVLKEWRSQGFVIITR
jgi:hydrogenase maturation protease